MGHLILQTAKILQLHQNLKDLSLSTFDQYVSQQPSQPVDQVLHLWMVPGGHYCHRRLPSSRCFRLYCGGNVLLLFIDH